MREKTPFEALTAMRNANSFYIFHNVTMENKNSHVHWHDAVEFLCCTACDIGVYYDTDVVKMKKGETIIVNSKSIHYVAPEKDMHCYCLIVDKSFFEENEIDISSLEFCKKANDLKAYELMENVHNAIINKDDEFGAARKRQAILTYILYMCEKYSHEKTNDFMRESKAYLAVMDAIEYIDKNFSKRITLESIAKRSNYSKYHFSRLFKESTKYTIVEHLNKKRVEYAHELLSDDKSKKTLSQICDECGFASYAYFSKCFKDEYGILPSDFKRKSK